MGERSKNIDGQNSYESVANTEIDLDNADAETVVEDISEKHGKLSFLQSLGLVVGLQIGSGIFSSPNQIHIHAGSIGASLVVWCVSGLLAWSGAACYAELGSAIPANGGTQAYLSYIFGDLAAYLFSWISITVLKPGSAGIIAIVLAEYLSKDAILKRVIAITAVCITSGINVFGYGAHAGTFFLVFKAVLLLGVAILGFVMTTRRDHSGDSLWQGTHSFGDIVVALYGGTWAYEGWDNLNFVAAEMKNPKRDISRVIFTAMPLTIVAYCVVNMSYFGALSETALDESTSVALTVASLTGHKAVEFLVSGGIALSCAGALNASMVSTAKIIQLAAETNVLRSCFAEHKWAVLMQTVVTICFCVIGDFKVLVTFYGAACYSFYLAAVVGLLVLRWREPGLDRPFKTWLIAPIIFTALSVMILGRTLITKPLQMLWLAISILSGALLYYYGKYRS